MKKAFILSIIITILTTGAVYADIPTPTAIPTDTFEIYPGVTFEGIEPLQVDLDDEEICGRACYIYQNFIIAANTNGLLEDTVYVLFAIAAFMWVLWRYRCGMGRR